MAYMFSQKVLKIIETSGCAFVDDIVEECGLAGAIIGLDVLQKCGLIRMGYHGFVTLIGDIHTEPTSIQEVGIDDLTRLRIKEVFWGWSDGHPENFRNEIPEWAAYYTTTDEGRGLDPSFVEKAMADVLWEVESNLTPYVDDDYSSLKLRKTVKGLGPPRKTIRGIAPPTKIH
ncbi:MAG TPA: hypothetical protein VIE65_12475 [Methylobacter sp.]|jgi:hypothetical protein